MPPDFFRTAADVVVAFHLAFTLFVALGGLLALRWRWVPWIHIPAVVWGTTIEFGGWICPLTLVENELRRRGGDPTYQGDFVAQYLLPLLYPAQLTRAWQVALGLFVLTLNLLVYRHVMRRSSPH